VLEELENVGKCLIVSIDREIVLPGHYNMIIIMMIDE
jgi:hypothetical protein